MGKGERMYQTGGAGMKIAELKGWIRDLPDDEEITLFVNVNDKPMDIEIETMITTEKDGVKKYYLHGGKAI